MDKVKKRRKKGTTKKAKKAPKVKKIPFIIWFTKKLQKKEVQGYQEAEIKAFFKNQGLTDLEDIEIFDKIFLKY